MILNGLWRERAVVLGSENIRLCQVKRMAEGTRFGTLGDGVGDGGVLTGDKVSDSDEAEVRGGADVGVGEPD